MCSCCLRPSVHVNEISVVWFKPPSFVVLQLGPDIRSFCDAPVEPKWRKCVFYHICWHWGVISGPTHTQVCLKTKLFPHVLTFRTHVNAISRRWKRNLWKTFACLCCWRSCSWWRSGFLVISPQVALACAWPPASLFSRGQSENMLTRFYSLCLFIGYANRRANLIPNVTDDVPHQRNVVITLESVWGRKSANKTQRRLSNFISEHLSSRFSSAELLV